MPTVRAMRPLLRNAIAISASASLVFFWSCERHEVGELPDHQQHGKPGDAHHAKGTDHAHKGKHDDDKHGHAHDKPGHGAGHADDNPTPSDGGQTMHGTGSPAQTHDSHQHASPAGTPAQFFPSPTPQ